MHLRLIRLLIPLKKGPLALFFFYRQLVPKQSLLLSNGHNPPKLTQWVLPNTGEMKLNTNGYWYDSNKAAGFGGLFRDDQGKWCLGYYGELTCTSSFEAELWRI